MSTFCNYWNKVSLVKSKIKKSKKIDSIGIGLASPEEIRRWGERRLPNGTLIGKVDKDHTVDYESLKPIEGGLFCERIFGPVEDFYCSCERKGEKNEKFCPNCEVEFTKSRVRRIRMGYIPLAVPVVHVWYLRGRPSYIANLVGKSRNSIDRLAYGETLSESFIGYSSLESIYKKEEDFFPKRIQRKPLRGIALPQRGYKSSICTASMRWKDNANAKNGGAAHTLDTSSNAYPFGVLHTPLQISDLSGVSTVAAKQIFDLSGASVAQYPTAVKEQKYLKCHTLPLFSTFVYKEWSHRFSFLEYFIWSARKNDLILPFYAYQNSRSERRLANICESIRKSSINLIKNKFSLRFSNKSNSNTSFTNPKGVSILSNEAPGSLALQEQKIRPHFLQLRNKESALRFIKVNKDIDFLFYTKPNSSDIRRPHSTTYSSNAYPFGASVAELAKAFRFSIRDTAKNLKASDLAVPQRGNPHISFSDKSLIEYACGGLKIKDLSGSYCAYPFRGMQSLTGVSSVTRKIRCIPHSSATLAPHTYPFGVNARYKSSYKSTSLNPLQIEDLSGNEMCGLATCKKICLAATVLTPSGVCKASKGYALAPLTNLRFVLSVRWRGKATCIYPTHIPQENEMFASHGLSKSKALPLQHIPLRGTASKAVLTNCGNERVNCLNEGSPHIASHTNRRFSFDPPRACSIEDWSGVSVGGMPTHFIPSAKQGVKGFDAPLYAFSTMQQDTESTPLNKMDTQQFPRLTELLNFTGGAALRNLLSRFDLIVLSKFLRHELKNLELKVNSLLALKMLTYSQGLLLGKLAKRRSKQIRRLKLLELFQSQKSNPEWMILSVIPVLPPDLRPILRVNDDFVVASDLNRLYQTVLRRNNTIHERLDDPLPCPESGLFRQRSLQKAVDGLLENGKGGGTPLCASKRRPLVSLSHVLKGKKGLFRQHLLGKRVDYSGRSVIVVGPRLQLHECGLPKEMAIELFQPFLLHRLKVKGLATSNTTARRMIQQGNPVIWHLLKQLVYEHPVLLNRAPTLHRLGIQAFQPRLVSGRAILLHPLVCNGFNADFDGDQMAVHVPLSFQARAEAWKIMWSKNNFLSPATGQPILVPSQDMVLGCYYLSVSIPRILNANVNVVSHDKAMTNDRAAHPMACKEVKLGNKSTSLNPVAKLTPDKSSICKGLRLGDLSGDLSGNEICGLPRASQRGTATCKDRIPKGLCIPRKGSAQQLPFTPAGYEYALGQSLHSQAFLNENKGQYFSNLQDSLLAYFQGRLQTHTPFWVRIDHRFAKNDKLRMTNNELARAKQTLHSLPNPKGVNIPQDFTMRVGGYKSSYKYKSEICQEICQKSLDPEGVSFATCTASNGMDSTLTPLETNLLTNRRFVPVRNTGYLNRRFVGENPKGMRQNNCVHDYRITSNNVLQRSTNAKIDNDAPLKANRALELTFLQPLYGSSREMCKTLFQRNTNNSNASLIRVEANEILESPLELRLSVDGNLANILTMFQNHYNYNATWVKQCKEESIKYMRTTAGRVVINDAVFRDF